MNDLVPEDNNALAPASKAESPAEFSIPPELLGIAPESLNNPETLARVGEFSIQVEQMPSSFNLNNLPHPHFLKMYDEILPHGAERIFGLLEDRQKIVREQMEHRHRIEERQQKVNEQAQELDDFDIKGRLELAYRGQLLGLFAFLVIVGVGIFLAMINHPLAAGALFLSGLGAVFVTGRHVAIRSRLTGKGLEVETGGSTQDKKQDSKESPKSDDSSKAV